jgi:hypothetical protein
MCVAGHQNFGRKELEECGIKWGRMAGNSEEGQGPQRAVAPMMMMMIYIYIYMRIYGGRENSAHGRVTISASYKMREKYHHRRNNKLKLKSTFTSMFSS